MGPKLLSNSFRAASGNTKRCWTTISQERFGDGFPNFMRSRHIAEVALFECRLRRLWDLDDVVRSSKLREEPGRNGDIGVVRTLGDEGEVPNTILELLRGCQHHTRIPTGGHENFKRVAACRAFHLAAQQVCGGLHRFGNRLTSDVSKRPESLWLPARQAQEMIRKEKLDRVVR